MTAELLILFGVGFLIGFIASIVLAWVLSPSDPGHGW